MLSRVRYLVDVPKERVRDFEDVFFYKHYIDAKLVKKSIRVFTYEVKLSPMFLYDFDRDIDISKRSGIVEEARLLPF